MFLYDTLGGSARVQAAYAVGLTAVVMQQQMPPAFPPEAWTDSTLCAMLTSLYDISGVNDVAGKGTRLEQRAAALARQNQDAQAEIVNSFAWSRIAASLAPAYSPGQSCIQDAQNICAELVEVYNARPDVELSDKREGPPSKRAKTSEDDADIGIQRVAPQYSRFNLALPPSNEVSRGWHRGTQRLVQR